MFILGTLGCIAEVLVKSGGQENGRMEDDGITQ